MKSFTYRSPETYLIPVSTLNEAVLNTAPVFYHYEGSRSGVTGNANALTSDVRGACAL